MMETTHKTRKGPVSSVYSHPEVARIELEIASGRSLKSIGSEFGVSKDALSRHWKRVSPTRKAELIAGPVELGRLAKRAAEEDRSLLEWLAIVRSEAFHLYQDARNRGLVLDASSILQRILNTLTKTGELTGQLRNAGINITNIAGGVSNQTLVMGEPTAAEIIRRESAVIGALSKYPEARAAVIEALAAIEPSSRVASPRTSASDLNSHALPAPETIDAEVLELEAEAAE
jgi:hypothetical protein